MKFFTADINIRGIRELYVVGALNLCPEKPGTMQKESAQSNHPARRKLQKCGLILMFQANLKRIG
jgi:hypothetical protein